jgi:hypothetical protein
VSHVLLTINSSVNFVVYICCTSTFRNQVKILLTQFRNTSDINTIRPALNINNGNINQEEEEREEREEEEEKEEEEEEVVERVEMVGRKLEFGDKGSRNLVCLCCQFTSGSFSYTMLTIAKQWNTSSLQCTVRYFF